MEKLRNEIINEFKWDLTHIYKNDKDFYKECDTIKIDIDNLKNKNIVLTKKPDNSKFLKDYIDLSYDITKRLYKLHTYVQRKYDVDQNNDESNKLVEKVNNIFIIFSTNNSFISDHILKLDSDIIDNFLSDNILSDYHFLIADIIRNKQYFLSKNEEELLSKISDVYSTPNDIYNIFKNTELKYNTIITQNGDEIEVNDINFRNLRESNSRIDRKNSFDAFFSTYNDYKNTFSKLLFKDIKSTVTINKIRKYKSSLYCSLNSENIPIDIYDNLILSINNNLDGFYKYLNFRKEYLNISDMNYYDLYNSLITSINYCFTYEQAKQNILKSTTILGDEYNSFIKEAFDNKWIDIYPNRYKETGAYMSGSAYDIHPYILINYTDKYNDMSTLSHELGHAIHSSLSNKYQKFNKSSYSTFIAEIASTTNEILLFDYMYNNTEDEKLKIFLLNNYIDHFRTTVFRQTMFAEFEKFMYDEVEKDEVLTPTLLNNKYLELLNKYHGVNDGIMNIEKIYANEWSFIPHFYYNFYVYQYSTSFLTSVVIAKRILNGDKDQLDKYLELLKSGGSDYPVELLKKANIDLTKNDTYKIAFDDFNNQIYNLKKMLKK